MVRAIARQHVRRRDQLALGINRDRRLMSIETPPRALATMAHLRVVHGHNTIRADYLLETSPVLWALDVLHQQTGKQPSRLMQPLAQWLVCGELLHRLSDH